MYNSKKSALQVGSGKSTSKKTSGAQPAFVTAALKKGAETRSGNGALKYSSTGNAFVDQFGNIGSFKAIRTFSDIERDAELLWASNPLVSVIFILYLRMITRIVSLFDGFRTKTSQKGAGLKHEAIMRMLWLHQKAPQTFWKNIGLFVSVGSWKDVISMLQYDLVYHGWEGRVLDWTKFGELILGGLNNEKTVNLVKKYLPQIKAASAATTVESQADTIIGKWICSLLFGNKGDTDRGVSYKKYRKLKTSGTAHEWQKLISQGKHNLIDFNSIHGRALNLMVRSKYLKNQKLEDKYNAWITAPETKDVKYTGFVHELFQKLPRALSQLAVSERETINKQFDTLVKKGGDAEQSKLIVVRDTSGSMDSPATGTTMNAGDLAKAIALYFSEFLTGSFKDAWIEFNSDAMMHTWAGNTPLEKWYNDKSSYVGGTDFQSVIRLFTRLKKQGIPESEFPTGILCISDGEFNPAQLGQTNVQAALQLLRSAGFSQEFVNNFVIVLWNVRSRAYGNTAGNKFETYGGVPNVYYFSGFEPSVISFLTSKIRTASELFDAAMDQEILNMVEL